MRVRGTGELRSRLPSTDGWVGGSSPVVAFDSVRDRDRFVRRVEDLPFGEPIRFVFADDQLLFVAHTTLARNRPCPRCLLKHMVTRQEQVAFLEGGRSVAPSEDVLEYVAGSEFAARLRGIDDGAPPRVLVNDVAENREVVSETAVRHPNCSHGEFPRADDADAELSTLDEARDALSDTHFGLVRDVRKKCAESITDDVRFYTAKSVALNPLFHEFPERFRRFQEAGGSGLVPDSAVVRAFMEGVERHCMLSPRSSGVTSASADLDRPFIPPDRFYLYSDEQYDREEFPYARYDPTDEHRWVSVTDIQTRREVYVPEEFSQYVPSDEHETSLVESNSNGFAAHFSRPKAILGGLSELLERDAVMCQWYDRTPTNHVRPETLSGGPSAVVEEIEDRGYDVRIADVTRFSKFPCYAVTLLSRERDDPPFFICAGGCSLDPTEALESAVFEAFNGLVVSQDGGVGTVESASDVRSAEDHLHFYQRPDRLDYLAPFTEPGGPVDFEMADADCTLDAAIAALDDLDVRVLFRDVTPEYLSERGVSVVRTLSPDLVPITFGYGHERLERPTHSVTDNRTASVPHPFP